MKRKLRINQNLYIVAQIDFNPDIFFQLNKADGQIGSLAVFTNKKKAKKHAGKFSIIDAVAAGGLKIEDKI